MCLTSLNSENLIHELRRVEPSLPLIIVMKTTEQNIRETKFQESVLSNQLEDLIFLQCEVHYLPSAFIVRRCVTDFKEVADLCRLTSQYTIFIDLSFSSSKLFNSKHSGAADATAPFVSQRSITFLSTITFMHREPVFEKWCRG